MAAETEFEAAMQKARGSTAALTETATKLAAAVRRAEELQQLGWCKAGQHSIAHGVDECPACIAEAAQAKQRDETRPGDER